MIRNNRRSVMFPWTLVIAGHSIRLSDEDFFTRIRDLALIDIERNRLERLNEIYDSLVTMNEQHGVFYIRNSQEIDALKSHIGNFIGQGNEPSNKCHAFCFCEKQ